MMYSVPGLLPDKVRHRERTRNRTVRLGRGLDYSFLAPLKDYNMADTSYDHLQNHIGELQKSLDSAQNAVTHYCSPSGDTITASWFGHHTPNMLISYGQDPDDA
jgi:hypothetical protein